MTTQSPDATEQVAWLVEFPPAGERYENGKHIGPAQPTRWFASRIISGGLSARTSDPNTAVRFCRREDAEAMILYLDNTGFSDIVGPTRAFASEHVWLGYAEARAALSALPSNATTNASLVEALEAIREPTAAMIEAAAATPGMKAAEDAMVMQQVRGYAINPEAVRDGSPLHQAWRAMIDTALATLRASNPDEEGK